MVLPTSVLIRAVQEIPCRSSEGLTGQSIPHSRDATLSRASMGSVCLRCLPARRRVCSAALKDHYRLHARGQEQIRYLKRSGADPSSLAETSRKLAAALRLVLGMAHQEGDITIKTSNPRSTTAGYGLPTSRQISMKFSMMRLPQGSKLPSGSWASGWNWVA